MTVQSKRGGRRPGSGRKKGIPNKNTFELKLAAAKHGEEALGALILIIRNKETPPNVIVSACREVLDRGFGRPAITIDPQEINLNVFPVENGFQYLPRLSAEFPVIKFTYSIVSI